MDGAALNVTVSTVLLVDGNVPLPTRKNRNLPMLRLKSRRALAETACVVFEFGAVVVCVSAQQAGVVNAHTSATITPCFI
jgi:hypothetical protein